MAASPEAMEKAVLILSALPESRHQTKVQLTAFDPGLIRVSAENTSMRPQSTASPVAAFISSCAPGIALPESPKKERMGLVLPGEK